MTIFIFLVILSLLIFVHELGHFLLAKKAGVFVEEFGFGYPPRAFKIGRKWNTDFTINWIPFGGFVKILGENYDDIQASNLSKKFTEISKKWQALILVAGVTFNLIFAWLLLSLGFVVGVPTPVENTFGGEVKNPVTTVTGVLKDSPAEKVGLKSGDRIVGVSLPNQQIEILPTPESISNFIKNTDQEVRLQVERGKENLNFKIRPTSGIVPGEKVIGINMDLVGTLVLPVHQAFYQGAKTTFTIAYMTVIGLFDLLKGSVRGEADLSQVTGPVGIVGLVGDASKLGFVYLMTFTALISINLAVVNLIPFPALDGGRLLFVIIESLTRRPINPKFAQITNTISFTLLIVLMLFITYRDILNLFLSG